MAPRPLTGEATIRLNVFDGAKNTTSTAFSITVARANGPITSLTHSAARALLAGEDVQVDMLAPAGGRATFDVIDETNRALAQAIPMREFGAGRYRGSYRVQANPDNLKLRLVGHYTDANNQVSHVEATTPVLALGVTPPTLAIMEPVDSARINSPVVVRGRAAPNSIVDVSLRVEGVRLQVLPYQQDLPMQQVLSDGTGSWTAQFDLPRSRNLTNWQYIITAAQADPTNRRSLPVAVVIKSPVVVARVVSKPVVIAKKVFPVRGWLASRGGNRYSKPAGVKKGAVSKKAVRPKANSKKPGVNKPALKKTAAIKARPTY